MFSRPSCAARKGEFKKELAAIRERGLTRVRIDGEVRAVEEEPRLDRRRNHWIDVVVDRLVVRRGAERRLTESIEFALTLANDVVIINTLGGGDRLFSRRMACVDCGINVPEMTPRAFSFNSPHGACPACHGLGAVEDFDPARIVPDESITLSGGAIRAWAGGDKRLVKRALTRLSSCFGIDLEVPFRRLPRRHRDLLLFGPNGGEGTPRAPASDRRKRPGRADPFGKDFEGVVPNLRRRYDEGAWAQQEALESYRGTAAVLRVRWPPAAPGELRRAGEGTHDGGLRQRVRDGRAGDD